MFNVLVVPSGRNREMYLYSFFPEVEIPRGYIFMIPLVSPTVPNTSAKRQALFRKTLFLGDSIWSYVHSFIWHLTDIFLDLEDTAMAS